MSKQGDHAVAVEELISNISFRGHGTSDMGLLLHTLNKEDSLSGGEKALVWFANQLWNGELQAKLGILDGRNATKVVKAIADFAGVDLLALSDLVYLERMATSFDHSIRADEK